MTTCGVDGCEARHFARGYCNTHYQRWKRLGTHELTARATTCLAADCDGRIYSLQLCLPHFESAMRGLARVTGRQPW